MSIGHMNISQDGIDMIKSFEGFRAQSYKCVVTERYFTIGYGHYGPDVRLGQVITKAEGERLLQEDLKRFVNHVNKYDYIYDFNQSQFDALVSFAYNIGSIDQLTANGTRSKEVIAEKMLLYNKSGGKVLPGLVNRRKAEQALFLSGKTDQVRYIEIAKPTLRRRCKSDKVKVLQENLNTLFGESLNVDGSFGPLTQEAMYRAQETLKIGVDGIYGPVSEEGFKKRARERGFTIR